MQQPAGAAAAAAATATSAPDTSQPQTPQALLTAASQTRTVERSSSAVVADMQQLTLDAPASVAASSVTAAPAGQRAADDWMLCPLSKVGQMCHLTVGRRPIANCVKVIQ